MCIVLTWDWLVYWVKRCCIPHHNVSHHIIVKRTHLMGGLEGTNKFMKFMGKCVNFHFAKSCWYKFNIKFWGEILSCIHLKFFIKKLDEKNWEKRVSEQKKQHSGILTPANLGFLSIEPGYAANCIFTSVIIKRLLNEKCLCAWRNKSKSAKDCFTWKIVVSFLPDNYFGDQKLLHVLASIHIACPLEKHLFVHRAD